MKEFSIFVLSHGNFAKEALVSAEMILGEQGNVKTFGLFPGMGLEDLREPVEKAMLEARAQGAKQFVFLTDLPHGTPSNLALRLSLEQSDITNISGFNMPLLIELCSCDAIDMALLAEVTQGAGESVVNLTQKAKADLNKKAAAEEDL